MIIVEGATVLTFFQHLPCFCRLKKQQWPLAKKKAVVKKESHGKQFLYTAGFTKFQIPRSS